MPAQQRRRPRRRTPRPGSFHSRPMHPNTPRPSHAPAADAARSLASSARRHRRRDAHSVRPGDGPRDRRVLPRRDRPVSNGSRWARGADRRAAPRVPPSRSASCYARHPSRTHFSLGPASDTIAHAANRRMEQPVKLSVEQFRIWEHKCITLLGLSGGGKTCLAVMLRARNWFHYSGDYRIGTRYLDEPIVDNITVDNLNPVSSFLGKLGDPEQGGLPLKEFKRRQELHRQAEIAAMKDVPEFFRKAQEVYGYRHFVNDAGGSVCERDDPEALRVLAEHTLILYIKATAEDEQELIRRAVQFPKPLYNREAFLTEQLDVYMRERNLPYVAMIDPDDFVRWMFPRLFYSRIPRYEAIAEQYGYTITTTELAEIQNEVDFLRVVEKAVAQRA